MDSLSKGTSTGLQPQPEPMIESLGQTAIEFCGLLKKKITDRETDTQIYSTYGQWFDFFGDTDILCRVMTLLISYDIIEYKV